MLTASLPPVPKKLRIGRVGHFTRFPHIVAAARAFGCHRTHLNRVLLGKAEDYHNLRARYAAFVADQSTK